MEFLSWFALDTLMSGRDEATVMVNNACRGDPNAPAELLPLVYNELRRLAAEYMARERTDHTLQATALVHEAYLRLVDQTQVSWQGRAHFVGVAARVMRQILVDHARRRGRLKRPSKREQISLDCALLVDARADEDLEALNEALTRLATFDERKARVVELRFFGGMKVKEVAEVLGTSVRTVADDWAYAKAWLHRELAEESSS